MLCILWIFCQKMEKLHEKTQRSKYPCNISPMMKQIWLKEVGDKMWREDGFFLFRSPYIVVDRRKIHNNSSHMTFWYFYQCTRQGRKRIDRVLLSTIFHIHVKLQSTRVMMSQFYFSHSEDLIRKKDIRGFFEFYIRIMCIELGSEKGSICGRSRKEKPDTPFRWKNLKSKKWLLSALMKIPPWLSMRKTMMKGGEHLTSDKNSFFISSIDGYLIRDDRWMRRHGNIKKMNCLHNIRSIRKRQAFGVANCFGILILRFMQIMTLSTSLLSLDTDTVLFDDGSLPEAVINVASNIKCNYFLLSEENNPTKRQVFLKSKSIFKGSWIYIWSDMVSQMTVNINGSDTEASFSLLALATENSKIKVDGIGQVEMWSKNITLRVDQTNILLWKNTIVQGKPVLEIATDNINGGHSCKVHRISWDALFYLESHGIDKKTAEGMLLDAEIRKHLSPLPEDEREKIYEKIQEKLGFLKQ